MVIPIEPGTSNIVEVAENLARRRGSDLQPIVGNSKIVFLSTLPISANHDPMGLCRAVLMEKKDALSTTRPTIKCGNMDLASKTLSGLMSEKR